MKSLKSFLIVVISLIVTPLFSQGLSANVGYAMIGKGKNTVYGGLDYRITDTDAMASNIGAGIHLFSSDSKLGTIPEIHFSQEIYLLDFKISATTKNIAPSIGVSIFNTAQFNIGYNFAYSDKNYQGIYLGINFFFGNENFRSSWQKWN